MEDIDEVVEALTTLSYREDEEVHLFIRATPGTPAFQEARHAFIAKEVAHVLMEGFIDGNRDEFQTEPFIARTSEMVRVYRDWIEKKRESIRHQSESACERFYATSKELIEQGLLPLEPERVERCLKDLRIEVLDPFFGVTKELWGQHDAESYTILLDTSIPEKAFYHVFAHEVMHALSGKTEVLNSFFLVEANRELDTNTTLYHVPRSGISFRKMVTDRPRNAEYTWLNEAITELCAEYFSHQTITYKEEQALLKLLIRLGLSWTSLLEAYFADDDLHAESTHPTPHVRALFRESERVFGKRFLADMNLIIESQPTKALRKTAITRILQYGEKEMSAFVEAVSEEASMMRRVQQANLQRGI